MRKAHWAAAIVGLVGACGGGGGGGGSEAPAAVTITFWRHDKLAYRKADDAAMADYMAAHPNVTITATTVDWFTYTSALNVDLKRNQFMFDLVLLPPSVVCSFADNLTDVPADLLSLSEAQNTFLAAPLAGSTCGGKLKGVPVEYNLEYGGVVVNLDKYQAKYPGKTPSWADWNAFIAEASALTEYDATGKPCANGLDIDPEWPEPARHILLGQILQRGGHYWSPSGDTFDFNTQEARDSLTEMVKWVTTDKVMFTSLIPGGNVSLVTNRMATGATGYGCGDPTKPLSVMGYVGTWGLTDIIGQLPAGNKTRYGYYALPPMVGTEHKFVQNSGFAFGVPRTSKNPQVAWDFVKSLALSPEAMRKWAATAGTLPALRVNATPAVAASDPVLAQVQPLLERGQWMGYIPAASTEAVLGTMVSNYFAVVKGTKTIEQALADMQQTANNSIAQNRAVAIPP